MTRRLSDAVITLKVDFNWRDIAEGLYRELDAIELMSDPDMQEFAPEGIDRLEQIHYTARSATERYILKTTEKT